MQNYALSGGNWGSGVTPKALIVWASNQAATGTQTAAGMFAFGFATNRGGNIQTTGASWLIDPSSTASQIVAGAYQFDAAGAQKIFDVFKTVNSTTADWSISFNGFSTDQWSINWTDLPATASTFLHYMVLGGTDVSDAYTGKWVNSATTPQTVALPTGFGQPDLIGLASALDGTFTGSVALLTEFFHFGVGWAVSDTERAVAYMVDQDAAATMVTASWAKARAMVGTFSSAAANFEMDLAARGTWGTDDFRVTLPDTGGGNNIMYLALQGTFSKKILESRTTATATGNQDHDAGFAPKAALGWGHVMPSAQTIQRAAANADATMLWVGATDGTNQAVAGVSQDDGKTTSFGRGYAFNTQTLHVAEAVAAATRAQATGSFTGNNVRLTYGTANATARQFHLLALGDAATGPALIPIVNMARI